MLRCEYMFCERYFTSRISGQGNRIGPFSVCPSFLCVCQFISALRMKSVGQNFYEMHNAGGASTLGVSFLFSH